MREQKKPKLDRSIQVAAEKRPTADSALTVAPLDYKPLWKFEHLDLGGDWGWSKADRACLENVLEHLRSYETMTWREIERKTTKHGSQSHPIETHRVCKEARDRLCAIKLDDRPELYSLRIGGRPRVWGYRKGRVLHIVWWDPTHSVYPV